MSNEFEYVKLTTAQADGDLGKLSAGQVVALPPAKAARWLRAGIAIPSSREAFDDYRSARFSPPTPEEEPDRPVSAQDGLRAAFSRLNAGADGAPPEDAPEPEPKKARKRA